MSHAWRGAATRYIRYQVLLALVCIHVCPIASGAQGQVLSGSEQTIEIEPRYAVGSQPVDQRHWVDVDLEKRFSVSKGEDYFLYGGWEVDTDSTGNFYFLDREDRRVKKFDSQGNFVTSIGEGRGAGPAEFQWPMDFTVTPDGEVWIIDSHRRKLSRFSRSGSLAKSYQLDGTSASKSLALTENGNAIVLAHGSGPVFRKWNPSGKLLTEFGTLVRDQKRTFMALDGMIRAGPRGFVFAPNRTGHLLRFSADSTLEYAVKTMDDVPYPTVEYSSGQYRSVGLEPVRRFSTLDVEVVNGKIYCFSHPASSPGKRVLDVYRYDDGRYLYSLELPVDFKKFGLTEDFLIEVHPGEMTVWRWERAAVSTEN